MVNVPGSWKNGHEKDVLESFERGERELKNAEKFLEIDLITATNRIYVSGENLAFSLITAVYGSSTRDHGKMWNKIHELYQRGIIKADFKPTLETSYRLRIKGDYGRDIDGVVIINKGILKSQINSLKEFLEEVRRVLNDRGFIE